MLYDLSIQWTPSTTAAELENTLAMSAELGYDVVALDHVYSAPVPAVVVNPIPDVTAAAAAATAAAPRRRLPRVLRRATVVIADTSVNHRLAAVATAYDLVAVRPTTERAFQAACLSMAEPALISLDLATYFPFFFKHRAVMAAVRRGVHFEVCYAQALASSGSDGSRARALFVANLAGLLRATRGRGLVVSSGAAGPLTLRAPADVVNLLAVWGLAVDRGTEALGALPRSIVANEGLKRRGFRGVVDIVQTAGEAEEAEEAGENRADPKRQQQQQQKQKQKQKQPGKDKGGQKQKQKGPPAAETTHGVDRQKATGEPPAEMQKPPKRAADGTPNKRQTKKQRKSSGA